MSTCWSVKSLVQRLRFAATLVALVCPLAAYAATLEDDKTVPLATAGTDSSSSPSEPSQPAKQPAAADAQPQTSVATPDDRPSNWHFVFGAQILAYGTYNGIRKDSNFNPSNLLAQFEEEGVHAAFRPEFKASASIFSLSAKPRLDFDHGLRGSGGSKSYYLQEWNARLQLFPAITLSYGREVLMWGPSMSVPASNPFFTNNGRNTPLVEIGARDFGRIVWTPDPHFALSYIANTSLRRGTPDFVPFKQTAAIKADYIGRSILLSGIYSGGISQPFGQHRFIGGYFQSTIGQAVRFYAEGSAEQGNPTYFPAAAANPVGWTFSQTRLNSPLKPRTIVGGLAYTDTRGGTWTTEYIYNPYGYASMVANSFFDMARDLSASFSAGGPTAGLAAQELALARDPGAALLRRHYAFAQYQRNGLFRHFDVVLRYTLNVEDRGGQGVAYVTYNASNHFQFFAVVAAMNGSGETEFARYLRYQAQIGMRAFLH